MIHILTQSLAIALLTISVPSSAVHAGGRDADTAKRFGDRMLVERARLLINNPPDLAQLEELVHEIESCGLSYSGPLCLNSKFEGEHWASVAQDEKRDAFTFFSVFRQKDSNRHYGLAVQVSKNDLIKAPGRVTLFSYDKVVDAEVVKTEALKGKARVVIDVQTPADPVAFAKTSAADTKNFRALYHFSQYLLDLSNPPKKELTEILIKKFQLITRDGTLEYQNAFLNQVRGHFPQERSLLIQVAQDLIGSANETLSLMSAFTLAEQGAVDAQVRDKILTSLKNSNANLRYYAVLGLGLIKASKDDENLLIGMILDPSDGVSRAAFHIVNQLSLTNEHLAALTPQIRHANPNRRYVTMDLLYKISTPEAMDLILERFDDSSEGVRNRAVQLISSYGLTDRELPQLINLAKVQNIATRQIAAQFLGAFFSKPALDTLIQLSNDPNANVRYYALQSITKNSSSDATIALINKIHDASDGVSGVARQALNARTLSNVELPALRMHLWDQDPSIRYMAMSYVSAIDSPEATAALIPMLLDASEGVRGHAKSILEKRKLGDAEVSLLAIYIRHVNTPGRQNVAIFLGKILTDKAINTLAQMSVDADPSVRYYVVMAMIQTQHEQATATLIDRSIDSSDGVRSQARSGLNGRSFSENHVDQFGVHLNDSDANRRYYAAQYMGTTSSQKALDLLTERLVIEKSQGVITEIQKSIQAIRKRLGK